ncbi:hypothetical protein C7H10_05955 [Marinobacter shengliensis]|nr:hypothetical protein C7H10_05955 [Marinobacter shengliensis]
MLQNAWRGGWGKSFPKVLRAKDGPNEAHMDVLVASFGKDFPQPLHGTQTKAPRNEKTRHKAGFLTTD